VLARQEAVEVGGREVETAVVHLHDLSMSSTFGLDGALRPPVRIDRRYQGSLAAGLQGAIVRSVPRRPPGSLDMAHRSEHTGRPRVQRPD
jgi:hypothetical protein